MYILRLAVIFLLSIHTVNAGGTYKEDTLLHYSGNKTVLKKHVESLNGTGFNTKSVSVIRIKREGEKKDLICKELRGIKQERANLERLDPFVSRYEQFRESQPPEQLIHFPTFARYRGTLMDRDNECVLFDRSIGQSVYNIMLEWTEWGYGFVRGEKASETKRKLLWQFNTIGDSIANFHLHNGKLDDETHTFNTIIHGDAHISNLFYGLCSNKTTFIDYETMSTDECNVSQDLLRLFEFSKRQIVRVVSEKAKEAFCSLHNKWMIDEATAREQDAFAAVRLAILDDFFQALKDGYAQAFDKAGYVIDMSTYQVRRK